MQAPSLLAARVICAELQARQEIEDGIAVAGQTLVAEVRVQEQVLFRRDLVIRGELGAGRTDRVHQADAHQYLCPDARREVLIIDIAEAGENSRFTLVERVEMVRSSS